MICSTGGETGLMEEKLTAQDLMLNLKAAGFDRRAAEEYLACWRSGEIKKQLHLLAAKRDLLLHHVHLEEKQIACLDYLVYRVTKEAPLD